MLKTLKLLTFIVLIIIFSTGCDKEEGMEPIYFIGDSLIERWDLQSYFSAYITYNFGKGGEGIRYIEANKGLLRGKTAVVLIGCNDHWSMSESNLDTYVERYFTAINNLGAEKTYLLQLLPRFFDKDPENTDDRICAFNAEVEKRVANYPSFVYIKTYSSFMSEGKQIAGYFIDGVHLTEVGYTVLAEILAPFLNDE